jgi:hypothetical protein
VDDEVLKELERHLSKQQPKKYICMVESTKETGFSKVPGTHEELIISRRCGQYVVKRK